MTIELSLVADANLADPKSATTATKGQTFICDGAGAAAAVTPELNRFYDGASVEATTVLVTSNGSTITLSIEQNGGGDITLYFSGLPTTYDTTPADTVTLTEGTDEVPVVNYVYVLAADGLLTKNTSGFPAGQHAPVATVLCQTAASMQNDGPFKMHKWNDKISDLTDNGHLAHINSWIRAQHATWETGVAPTVTVTVNGGSKDNVDVATTAGTALQLHSHTFPARDTAAATVAGTGQGLAWIVNDFTTKFNRVTDLNAVVLDSAGGSLTGNNTYYALVLFGVVSEAEGDCRYMVNVPSGSYGSTALAKSDASNYTLYTIPSEFKGTGFLIARIILRYQTASSGTITEEETLDLRGVAPFIAT